MIVIAIMTLLALIYTTYSYNRIIGLIEAIRNNQRQIDIQLDRRFKVFESLIEVVKKHMDFESSTLREIVSLRQQSIQAGNQGNQRSKIAHEEAISTILGNIKLVFEQYPTLQSSKHAIQLQEEIVSTENKLSFAKQAYNDSIERYTAYTRSFPSLLIVKLFAQTLTQQCSYWRLSDAQITTHEAYTIKL